MVDDMTGRAEPGPLVPSEPAQGAGTPPQTPGPAPNDRAGAPLPTAETPPQPSGWVSAPVSRVEIAPGLVFASTVRRFAAYWVDGLIWGLAAYLIAGIVVAIVGASNGASSGLLASLVVALAFTGITFAYFVGTWRSRARATPGMRLFKLQIGNAFDGRTLTLDQAMRRWVAMGFPLSLLAFLPALGGLASLTDLILWIVLLLTTVSSRTKQGLHDRFASSAVVEPAGLGFGAVLGCIVVVVVVLPLIAITGIIALLFLGGQVSKILSTVGSPAP